MRTKIICTCICLLMACCTFAQGRVLKGTIKMNGLPVKGLTVYTSFASVRTDDLGRYAMPLNACPDCRPGYTLTVYTTDPEIGSSEQECTISNDYIFNFSIQRGSIVLYGIVTTSTGNNDALPGIEVSIVSGDVVSPPVLTNNIGMFKIPVPRGLLEGSNAIRLQVRDPQREYRPLRAEPGLYEINTIAIIRMRPGRSEETKVDGFIRSSVCVSKNDLVTIEASGHIRVGAWVGNSDPDGRPSGVGGFSLESYNIVSQFNHAALMYRIEGDREWKVAGKFKRFIAPRSGCIEFQVNDNIQDDNYGSYSVEVTVERG